MEYIAILSSIEIESELILSELKNIIKSSIAGKLLYIGNMGNTPILLFHTGIGMVNAAHAVTALIESYAIKCVTNLGIGGAYPSSGLERGDIAIASKEIYGDTGVITPFGWTGVHETGIPCFQTGKKKYFNEFPVNRQLLKKAWAVAGNISGIRRVKTGPFVTLSASTGTSHRAAELERKWDAVCENMEGAAIAHVCAMYGMPFLEVRGISNIAGIRDKRRWRLSLAAENCQWVVLEMISRC